MSTIEIMDNFTRAISQGLAEFSIVEGVREVNISGEQGARMTYRYTGSTGDGRIFAAQATLVVVPRGNLLYQFIATAPPRGADSFNGEVDQILQSVRFLE